MNGVIVLGISGCLTGFTMMSLMLLGTSPILWLFVPALAPVLGAAVPLSFYTREAIRRVLCTCLSVIIFNYSAVDAIVRLGPTRPVAALVCVLAFLIHGSVLALVFGVPYFWPTVLSFAVIGATGEILTMGVGPSLAPHPWLNLVIALASCGVTAATFGPAWQRKRVDWWAAKLGPPTCRRCGYNLTGNVSGVCPECGTPCISPGKGK